jgi:pimeloyl-ACP methyl ester carboxylesterase
MLYPRHGRRNEHLCPFCRFSLRIVSNFYYFRIAYSNIQLIELAHVSAMQKSHETVPSPKDFANCVRIMLEDHGLESAILCGHSIGTIYSIQTLIHAPDIVASCILIDPVCFRMFDARLIHQIIYRIPTTPFESAITYMVSRELYQSVFLSRGFHWHENTIDARKLPASSFVFVGTRDNLVDGDGVLAYLEKEGVKSEQFGSMEIDHAEFLVNSKAFGMVMSGFMQAFKSC